MSLKMVKLEEVCDILDSQRVPITARDRVAGPYPYYGANGIQDYVADYIFDEELVLLAEDGGNLSQGQKQLLCIARVMLCLPPMLILDEATSSIDTRTEIQIQKAFLTMMKGRTSFIVAHRLSTIREADIILVMKDGRIIEQGNHEELLAKNGFYANLYNSQFA